MMPSASDHCATLVRELDRERYLATLFAPAERRGALHALYAFNVEIARMRDVAREPMPREIRLQWWREALAGERAGEAAAHPVAAAVLEGVARYDLARERLLALVDAHTFDLYDEPMATIADVESYAERTQGALFALAGDILGARASEALTRHAGIAYAVAHMLRDFARDTARRQLFVPLDLLQRHGVSREAIFAQQGSDGLRAALSDMRALARRHLAAAQAQMNDAPAALLPGLLPAATIGPTLRRMERRGYDPFRAEPRSAMRRQWLLWCAARKPSRIFRS